MEQEEEAAKTKAVTKEEEDDILQEMLGPSSTQQDHHQIRRRTTKILIEEEAQRVDADISEEVYESIATRMRQYSLAANYCNKIMKSKELALLHLKNAEKLKEVSNKYKTTGQVEESEMGKDLTPEILFNCSQAEREEQFDTQIQELNAELQSLANKGRSLMEQATKVK